MEKHESVLQKFRGLLTKRALIIDDDPIFRATTKFFLERHKRFEVCALDSAQYAIDTFQNFAPNIVLLDFEMPDPNGYEIFGMLKRHFLGTKVPICFVTGSDESALRQKLIDEGAAKVFSKIWDDDMAENMYKIALQ